MTLAGGSRRIMFNGTVMRGEPAHANLTRATYVESVSTAPVYRLWSIDDQFPAMFRDEERGASITGELYEVPDDVWPGIEATEPGGLHCGEVELDDGRMVFGMLGSDSLAGVGCEITEFGGWREYRSAMGSGHLTVFPNRHTGRMGDSGT